jgi:pimeloyl-ACP methyl ester carboxylesterase
MNTITSNVETKAPERQTARGRRVMRRVLRGVGRALKWFGLALIALVVLGAAYQIIATEIDRRTYSPRGQLYTVNGRQMHLVCQGEGGPTVILQAGGAAESLWWYWVQNQLAGRTRVCAYDRAGMGWSEAASSPRDPVTIVGELHVLLAEAGVAAPYIMVGHSYGAILARVYAAQYPQDVTGVVVVDSLTVGGIASESELDQYKPAYYAAVVPVWLMQRLGVMRLLGTGSARAMGYPPEIAPELAALQSHNQTLDTDMLEKGLPAYWTLIQASEAAEDLGDLPLAVLWASESYATYDRAAVNKVATFSSNSVTRVIEGANHGSILGTEQYAQQVSDAILDVIEAAQTGRSVASE